MKLIARILLFVFVAFLSTPAIITVIKKSSDTSVFFSCSEEELGHKELKAAVYHPVFEHELVIPVHTESKLIVSENIVKLDNISPSIFAPPPNLA
jgi:Na+-transporting NADH:ubiquinone oxidoreductase subunit NqrB